MHRINDGSVYLRVLSHAAASGDMRVVRANAEELRRLADQLRSRRDYAAGLLEEAERLIAKIE